MKMLVATKETQGQRKNDFSHTNDGEPVYLAFECDGEPVDGACGCRRSFSGLTSRRATTTAKVVVRGTKASEYVDMIVASEKKNFGSAWDAELENALRKDALAFVEMVQKFPPDAVVEKRGSKFQTRAR